MKVLHVIDSGGLYGAETMLFGLIREQRRAGMEACILSLGNVGQGEKPIESAAREREIPVQTLRMRPGLNLMGALAIIRRVHKQRIDIIHTHGYKGNILMGLIPRFWRRAPVVSTLHGWTAAALPSRLALYQWLDRRMLTRLDAVVTVNEILRQDRRLSSVAAAKLVVIENGLDLGSLPAVGASAVTREFIKSDREFLIGAMGRLATEKGFGFLIEALQSVRASCPRIRAVILGEGPDRTILQRQIDDAGLHDLVRLVGYQSETTCWMREFDVFVLSSVTEGLPMTLLEAMHARIPIVATSVGGVPEALGQGQGGILIEPASPPALATAIEQIYRGEMNVRDMTEYSYQRLLKRYTSDRMAARYTEIYRSLLAKH